MRSIRRAKRFATRSLLLFVRDHGQPQISLKTGLEPPSKTAEEAYKRRTDLSCIDDPEKGINHNVRGRRFHDFGRKELGPARSRAFHEGCVFGRVDKDGGANQLLLGIDELDERCRSANADVHKLREDQSENSQDCEYDRHNPHANEYMPWSNRSLVEEGSFSARRVPHRSFRRRDSRTASARIADAW